MLHQAQHIKSSLNVFQYWVPDQTLLLYHQNPDVSQKPLEKNETYLQSFVSCLTRKNVLLYATNPRLQLVSVS